MTYLDHSDRAYLGQEYPGGPGIFSTIITHSWTDHTRLNLAQQYGQERADRIIAGSDPKTQADLSRWRSLGRRSAA